MRISREVVIDIETGAILKRDSYEYTGPLALADRVLAAQGKTAAGGAERASDVYGGEAQSLFANVVPTAERWAQGYAPGYGAQPVMQMQARAQEANQAVRGAMEEKARLRGIVTRNPAAVGAAQDPLAEASSRAQGGEIQNILASNAILKAREQQTGLGLLSGMYGTAMRGQVGMGQVTAEDLRAAAEAERMGWAQNLSGIMGGAGSLMRGYGELYKDLHG